MNYIITDTTITVFIDGKVKTFVKSYPNFAELVEAIKAGDEAKVKILMDMSKTIEQYGNGTVEVRDGKVYYKGKVVDNYLTKKILQLKREGFSITPLINFMERLENNPSYRARQELYQFLEYGNLPITPDGHFIAYKKVNSNYKDIWSNTFDNSVGAVCEMDRRDVDDDSSRTCSAGLHFASREYMKHYGSAPSNKIMAVKIDPADVVSIPNDYNNTKGRCCRYTVVAELGVDGSFDVLEDAAVKDYGNKADTPQNEKKCKGVTWDKHKGKFKAQLPTAPKNGGSRHIGYYETEQEACDAVRKAMGL